MLGRSLLRPSLHLPIIFLVHVLSPDFAPLTGVLERLYTYIFRSLVSIAILIDDSD
jgi:hypothetical protein